MLKEFVLSSPILYKLAQKLITKDKDILNLKAEIQPDFKVLDLGCGPASLLSNLHHTVEYHGMDPSAAYIENARNTYKDRNIHFYCAGIDEFNLSPNLENSFDTALAIGVLHHLDDAQAGKLLRIAHAALKHGGKLLTIDPYYPGRSFIANRLAKADRGQFVREPRAYEKLLRDVFKQNVSITLYNDRSRLPYNHIVMSGMK